MLTQERLRALFTYDPRSGIFRRKTQRGPARVGDAVLCRDKAGYVTVCIKYCVHYAHRLAFLYMTGDMPVYSVDHINGVRHDNRWSNLRDVSHSANMLNIHMPTKNAICRGVSWDSTRGKYKAQLWHNGMVLNRRFDSLSEAQSAYLEAKASLLQTKA